MNSVNLTGRITKDIELRVSEKSNRQIVGMFIAINNGKDKDGIEREADFPKIYVFDKQAENLHKYCHKGSLVGIDGRLKTRSWTKEDGTKGYETYVVANRVEFLETKKSESVPLPEPDYDLKESKDPFEQFGETVALSDDELPF